MKKLVFGVLVFVCAVFALPLSAAGCSLYAMGDVDCNGTINLVDFELFRKEFAGTASTKSADLNSDGRVSIGDFEIWRKGYFSNSQTQSPTPTPVQQITLTKTPTTPPTTTPSSQITPTFTPTPTQASGGGGSKMVSPGQSISAAMSSLKPGETLIVKGGTYTETVSSSIKGTSSAPIVVRAAAGERPVIKGLMRMNSISYVIFDGINVTWDSSNSSTEHMVRFSGGSNWVFKNAEVWGARSFAGIHVTGDGSNWLLSNLFVHDTYPANGTNQDHLIYASSAVSGVIERCLLINSANGRAIKLGTSGTGTGPRHVVIRYNTMYNNIGPSNIQLSYEAANNEIYRNIMQKSSKENITLYTGMGPGNTAHDNIGWESSGVVEQGGGVDTGGNLHIDPQFVSAQGLDFHTRNPKAAGYGKYAL